MTETKETKTDKNLGRVTTSWIDPFTVTGSAEMYSQGTTMQGYNINGHTVYTPPNVFTQTSPTAPGMDEIKEVFSTVVDGNHYRLVKDPMGFTLLKNDNIEYLYTEQDLIRIFLDFNTKEVMKDCDKLLKLL